MKPQIWRILSYILIAVAAFYLINGVLVTNLELHESNPNDTAGRLGIIEANAIGFVITAMIIVLAIFMRKKSYTQNQGERAPQLRYYLFPTFIGLAILVGLSVGTGLNLYKPVPNPYVNHQYGFSITYPDGWHGTENYFEKALAPEDSVTAVVVF